MPFAFCLLPFAFCLLFALSFFPGKGFALPSYQEVRKAHVKSDSVLLDRRGEVIQELRTDLNRRRLDWAPLKDISPALKEAVYFVIFILILLVRPQGLFGKGKGTEEVGLK